MNFLVAIPVYNEKYYICTVLSKVKQFAENILVIDDGSTDGSGDVLKQMDELQLITHAENQGYGKSLIDAFDFAVREGYDAIITMDCDEQHFAENIPEFVKLIPEWDIVSGSRYLQKSPQKSAVPRDRLRINRKITRTINKIADFNITDSFCGYKAYQTQALTKLQITELGYGMPLQLWIQAYYLGLRVTEIPVELVYQDETRHFGSVLDESKFRLEYYKSIIAKEVERWTTQKISK